MQVQGQPLMVQVSGGQLITSSGQPIMVQAMSGSQGQTIMQVPVSGAQGLQQVRDRPELLASFIHIVLPQCRVMYETLHMVIFSMHNVL